MAISLNGISSHSSGSLTGGTTSTGTATAPGGVTAGEYLLFVVTARSSGAPMSLSTPSGWTLIDSVTGGQNVYVLGKVATSADATVSGYTLSFSGGSSSDTNSFDSTMQRFGGVDTITPIDVAAADVDTGYNGSTATTTMTLPSVTTVTADAWQLAVVSMDDRATGTTTPVPSGFTQVDSSPFVALVIAYQDRAAAGATGTSTWTWTGSYTGPDMMGVNFALRPSNTSSISASDHLAATDSASRTLARSRSVTDKLALTDSVTAGILSTKAATVSDPAALTDAVQVARSVVRTVTDALTGRDVAGRVTDVTVGENVSITGGGAPAAAFGDGGFGEGSFGGGATGPFAPSPFGQALFGIAPFGGSTLAVLLTFNRTVTDSLRLKDHGGRTVPAHLPGDATLVAAIGAAVLGMAAIGDAELLDQPGQAVLADLVGAATIATT